MAGAQEGGSTHALPALHRLFPGAFYGWFIVAGGSLLSFVVVGVGFYGMAVFLDGLCNERGWSRTSVSFATSLYFVTTGLAGSLIGRSVDRHGARGWIAAGALVMGLALVLIGQVDAPWQLYLVYPLLGCGFAMTGGVPSNAIITRWFTARRARAMSIAQTGVSVGGVVLVPFATHLILSQGFTTATRVLAGLVVAVVLPVVLFMLRWDPAPYGLAPDGGAPAPAPAPGAELRGRHWTAREALATRAFWILVAAFGGILFCQVAVAMHQIALLRERIDPTAAAYAVSTTAFGSIVARLVVGGFADRVSKRRLGSALMLVQAVALVAFALAADAPLLYAASLLFGFTIGNLFMLQALLVAELFGVASFGSVLGLLQLVTQTASGLGPFALGLLYAGFGGYEVGLGLLAGLAVLSAAFLWRVPAPS